MTGKRANEPTFNKPVFAKLRNEAFDGEVDYARARVIKEEGLEGYIYMKLDVPLEEVPLGWYLSEYSLEVLNKRIKEEVDKQYFILTKILAQ